ncbi:MAG TPA: NAD(P)/FAD-dependent oxidoreductase [bacterium]|jgi:geranylgeranyl reductase family protein|nr:NAD(P)/FAD-dependent oxidoreductase [bacterium]
MKLDYDVIVVGAGPAGGMAALSAAGLGLRTALVEEHREIGVPTHCSGKLQLHAFREFDLPSHLILNTLQAGAFYAPDGTVARVRRSEPDSHVVDRGVFDRWLAARAQEQGAEVLMGTRLRAAERVNGAVRVRGDRGGVSYAATARVIIDAEGARPVLPRTLGLDLPRASVMGLQYQMAGVELERGDCPEVYLGTSSSPGFFAWLMPIGPGRGRVGLCVDPRFATRAPVHYLDALVREHPVASRRLRRAVVERKLAGPIPVLNRRHRTVIDGMIIAGDAAGHVKATSGGGIYFSLIGGRLAAQAAAGYVGGSRAALGEYERAWRRRFGREIWFTGLMRTALNQMTDADLNALIAALGDVDPVRQTVELHGDTAFQSRLLFPVLRQALRRRGGWPLTAMALRLTRVGLRALWEDGLSGRLNL